MNGLGDVGGTLRDLSHDAFIQIGLILGGAGLLIIASQRLLRWLADRLSGRARMLVLASVPVLRLLVIVAAVVMVVPLVVKPTFENLVALMGALGLALGFALKDYVSSLIAGVVTLYEVPYRPGDWIEVNGIYGEVVAIHMRSLEIVTPDDTVVIIPHLVLWNQAIFNSNDGEQNLQCIANFYLDSRHDAAEVKRVLHDVALTSAFLQIEQPVLVLVTDTPWGTHYRLKAYPLDPRQQFQFVTDLTVRGNAALIDLGVEFARVRYSGSDG